ncbi:MAG: N-acetyltransferase [Chitinophagia bacterium]|nr:N-acetyltransferase [Chitinophagia bacterium]
MSQPSSVDFFSALSVREATAADVVHIADYWSLADPAYLRGLGVDVALLPQRDAFISFLTRQLTLPYTEKQAYPLIWHDGERAIGHCNINQITFGHSAHLHLHIWRPADRHRGLGLPLVKASIPLFFRHFQLREINCEPYALNPAPGRLLSRAGFRLVKEYTTIPGSICFEQPVQQWVLDAAQFIKQ